MTELDFLEDRPSATRPTRRVPWLLIVVVVGFMGVVGLLGVQLSRENQTQPRVGQPAPEFTLTTFDGQPLALSDLRGQWVLVNFWGSWCPPCADEAPELQELYADYAERGLVVVGVNWLDTPSAARAFVAQYGITYPNGEDVRERVAKAYHIQGAPENFLVTPDGIVAAAWLGPVTYPTVADTLDDLLAQETGA